MDQHADEGAQSAFELVAELTSDVIVRLNLQGILTYVSPSVRKYGYAPEELVGTNGISLFHSEDQEKLTSNMAVLLLGGSLQVGDDFQRQLRKADGDWVWVETSPMLRRDSAGKPVEVIGVVRDIARRRAAEESLREQSQLFEAAFAHSAIGKCIVSLDGELLRVNAAQCRLSGYSEAELFALGPLAFDNVENFDAMQQTHTPMLLAGETGSYACTSRSRRADGTIHWVEFTVALVRESDGTPRYFVVEVQDLTEAREAKALLEDSELRFRLIAENTSDVIVVSDLEGRFTFVGPSVRWLGYEPAQLVGRSAADHTHPDDIEAVVRAFSRLLRSRQSTADIERIRWRGRHGVTGEWLWIESSPGLSRDPITGDPTSFIDVLRDISALVRQEEALAAAQAEAATASEALQESEARYRMIAEMTSDVIAISDRDGTITYLSPSIRQLGFEPEDLLGKTFTQYTHPEDAGRMWGILQRQKPGMPSERIRWRARHKVTGNWVWLESMPTRLWDAVTGEPSGFLDVIRDVSLQVHQEDALAKARIDAEAAALVKSQFLANMSHEIRTPLTAVLGYSDILSRAPGLDEKAQRTVQRIAGAGSALLAIVNDILDFSKLEAGRVDVRPSPTDLAEVVSETLALFENPAAAKALKLSIELAPGLPAIVMLDADRLRQLLVNLIGNAVKFTDHGQVTVRVVPNGDDQMVRFEVEDTGQGLDPEQCASLFQRFNQVDGSTTRRHGGTGLGLAICKGLVEAMGGEIGVTSRLSVGSTFYFTTPLVVAERAEALPIAVEVSALVGARVLVVDDNDTNRDLARRILEALSMTITEADGGAPALVRLAEDAFDVVLLDLRMPDLDGLEVLRRLRAQPGPNRETPVLAFTADATRGHGSGLEDFEGVVLKPIDAMALAESLVETLSRKRPVIPQEQAVAQA